MLSRRDVIVSGTGALAGAAALLKVGKLAAQVAPTSNPAQSSSSSSSSQPRDPSAVDPPGQPGNDYTPVITPNGSALPWKLINGVKVFHLIAEPVRHEFAPGLQANCWGYNGQVHGPTIEAVEGDRVRIYVTNRLPEPTSVHWHGILLPNGMDGVAGLTQKAIEPGETFKYDFTLRQHGTHMYHPHHDEMTQMAMGMMGLFIIHPRHPTSPRPDRDFAIMLSEWAIKPGAARPDPSEMTDFNVLTFNARVFPGTEPLVAKLGDRVRIRLGNLSAMDHHPIHLHGYQFKITQTDGGSIPPSAWWPETTSLTPVGSTRTVDFVADAPGDWSLHCHMTHHVMTQMGHGIPNMIGMDTSASASGGGGGGDLDQKVRVLVPGYMTMGQSGMGDMGEMAMSVPPNSLPMVGGQGPFGYITMGGMFTIFKVREGITSYEDPGWYQHPPGTRAIAATAEELRADGIQAP